MSSSDERILTLLRDARHQLELERERRTEPIAIVGIGCRLPGGIENAGAFWQLLQQGIDATGEVPAERWNSEHFYDPNPEAPGKAYVRRGAFLEGIDGFDAAFFGISPREAVAMDPQQRLLLEVVWEALEDAGIQPARLRNSNSGVWLGLCVDDYARRSITSGDAARIDAYSALGNARSIAAGRIAYVLDLHGPAVQLDTACSSSLVAVHQACQSLRSGESDLGLVGGVNLMSSPETTIALCKLRALAPDGRCKTFDASADGYGRGEGCTMVVLERLKDAQTSGHHIYAVIRGSAVNHDGQSNGLTAPNGLAQEAVISTALGNGGVDALEVSYVEAHGTGTLLGDPIEVFALNRVYGRGRGRDAPLYLGAVKTNFGHLEGAAGIAGLVKTALCLEREHIPRHLHFHDPNPKIPWRQLPVRVASEALDWPRTDKPRFAGVSSFGISGTNAHVVLQEAPSSEVRPAALARGAELVVLSAKTPAALDAAAARLREHLERRPDLALGDLAFSLVTTRSLLDQRLAFSVPSRAALLQALDAAAGGQTPPEAQRGALVLAPGKLAWLFTGQGAQRLGMGRELYAEWPAFRSALDAVCALLDPLLEIPLRDVMWAESGSARAALLDQTGFTQPALFALEWALAALWSSFGIEPDLLLGHSIGGIAAAAVAGVFSLEDAARLVAARARLMQALPAGGAMLSIAAPEAVALELLHPFAERVSLAAVNGPSSVVIAGTDADVASIAEQLGPRGIQSKRLGVSHAFHSPLMEPMLADFQRVAESIAYHAPRLPLISDSSGALAGAEVCTAVYWMRHVRDTVRFAPAVQALARAGARTFIELGPRPTLLGLVPPCLPEQDCTLLASLRPLRPEPLALFDALGAWVTRGGKFDGSAVFPAPRRRVPLPTYPWQRQRYWLDAPPTVARAEGSASAHPLLGVRVAVAGADAVYESLLSLEHPEWLQEHRVAGHIVVPATALAEMLRAAAEESAGEPQLHLKDLVFQSPLVVPRTGAQRIQVLITETGTRTAVYSQPAQPSAGVGWVLHATAEIVSTVQLAPPPLVPATLRERCPEALDVPEMYAALRCAKLEYGPIFQGIRNLWRGPREALSEVALSGTKEAGAYGMHPALLDAALQTMAALVESPSEAPFLPFEIGSFVLHQASAQSAFVHARLQASGRDFLVADLTLYDATGQVIAELESVTARRADLTRLEQPQAFAPLDAFYQLEWQAAPTVPPEGVLSGSWHVVSMSDSASARALAGELQALDVPASVGSIAELAVLPPVDNVVCKFEHADPADAGLASAADALYVAQALARHPRPPRLWWVTERAVAPAVGDDVQPAAAVIWGLGRALMLEHPALRCTLLDLDGHTPLLDALTRESNAGDEENQVVWRNGQRHRARLVRAGASAHVPNSTDYQLEAGRKGTLDEVQLFEAPRRALGTGEIEIEVRASGLNFRDVLNVLGMYPGEAGPLGGECSGVVTAVGSDVARFVVGDLVMALASGSFRRFVTVDARLALHVPKGVSLLQAATLPVVFLTAWHALHDLAGLRRGERLLVHAAAGGVGMAAIQVARAIGAKVLATASPTKWGVLEALGVRHVQNSRDLAFAHAFRADGGADVVLNSLAGEFIDASLSLLSPGGRFIEMGKADLRDPSELAGPHPGVLYRSFDLATLPPDRIADIFAHIARGFESGQFSPLPVRSFPITEAEEAFRFMAQARHVGKIALTAPRDRWRRDGTVLITGGLGALGLEVAAHFAQLGAQHLLLTGRRGLNTPGATQAVAALKALGAEVTVAAVDMADRAALSGVLRAIPPSQPLRFVVHAAGVLDDGILLEQSSERLARVLAPKALGAWHLHELTEAFDLDAFVLFSSMAGTLGSPGQSSYCAANAFLDALAAHRQAAGKPALSLAWGPWSEGGFAARLDPAQKSRFARQGIGMIAPPEGRMLFDRALTQSKSQLLVALLDLRTLAQRVGDPIPPLWRSLLRSRPSAAPSHPEAAPQLAALSAQERLNVVTGIVRSEVARILSLSDPAAVPLDRHFNEIGLDSLMAVELRNALNRRVGISLPATLAFEQPNLAAIVQYLVEHASAQLPGGAVTAVAREPAGASAVSTLPSATALGDPSAPEAALERGGPAAATPGMISAVATRGSYPATDAQQRLWFSYQLDRAHPAYNQGFQVRIRGELNAAALQDSVQRVVGRHEALRSRFRADADGQLSQWVDETTEHVVQWWDFSGRAEPDAALFAWIRKEERAPFNLEQGPVLRCHLVRLSEDTHVLALTCHHILIDGWSLGLLASEITRAYTRRSRGEATALPEVALQMGDYAAWEREQSLRTQRLTREGHSQAALPDAARRQALLEVPALLLPRVADEPPLAEEEGSILHFDFSGELSGRLRKFAAAQQVTLNTLLTAAFALLLSRYTGQNRFGLGAILANRSRHGQEGIVGFLANTLLLDCNLEGNPDFSTLLGRMRSEVEFALGNAWLPMSELLQSAGAAAAQLGDSQRLSAVFSYQGIFREIAWTTEQTTWELLNRNNLTGHVPGTAKFDLWLAMYPWVGGNLSGSLEFRTRAFDGPHAARLVQHFESLLDHLTRNPTLVSEASYLVRDDYEAWQRWNSTDAPYARGVQLQQLVEKQARTRPEAIALATQTSQVTYAQLEQRARAIATALRSAGVSAHARVGICLERSADMVAGLLAILKVQAAYVPLDPAFPAQRIAFMLEDSQAGVVLSESHVDGSLWPPAIVRIDLDRSLAEVRTAAPPVDVAGSPPTTPDSDSGDPGDVLMYVMYTSGSTGQPKGVCVRHSAVINLLTAIARALEFNERDALLAVTTLSFDIAGLELFLPLVFGGRIELASASEARDVQLLLQRLRERQVTVMQATPSTWQMFRAMGAEPQPHLRVLCGGEALPADLADWLIAHFAQVWNVYGPTETTIWSTACRLRGDQSSGVLIGSPLANTQLHVLDEQHRRVPIGVAGELSISGDGVAAGYFRRPELTAAKFVQGSWLGEPYVMYRTGDRVRQRWDGQLEYLGRLDHQVKLRGFRIELGEVEARLLQQPRVKQCVCVVRALSGEPALVAYLVAQAGVEPTSDDELLAQLGESLPPYMLPSAFVWIAEFPLTPNGKVDRKSLPDPASRSLAMSSEQVRADTEAERALSDIWQAVLSLERVGVTDDFFRLGGDSLKSVRIQAKAAQQGLPFNIRDLFEARTIRALARRVQDRRTASPEAQSVGENPAERERARTRLLADIRLDPSIRAAGGDSSTHDATLLTGATGFLGAHLLHELTEREKGPVYALVRGKSQADARLRVESALTQYGLPKTGLEHVHCLAGDLTLPQLGVSPEDWRQLHARLRDVYHSAAEVNHVLGYESLRAANVTGLEPLLALAAEAGARVHFISTMDVFDLSEYPARALVREDADVPAPLAANGYAQSKWVGEQIIRLATERGIDCRIFRLPVLGGHSESGAIAWHKYWFTHALRMIGLLGAVPDWPRPLQVVPVDCAARAILLLARSPLPAQLAFHLIHPNGLTADDLQAAFHARGRETRKLAVADWAAAVHRHVASSRSNGGNGHADIELEYLSSFLLGLDLGALARQAEKDIRFDRHNVESVLSESQVHLPDQREMTERVLGYLRSVEPLRG